MLRLRQHEVLCLREPRLYCFETLAKIWLCIDPAHVQYRLGNPGGLRTGERPRLKCWPIILEERGPIRHPAFKVAGRQGPVKHATVISAGYLLAKGIHRPGVVT